MFFCDINKQNMIFRKLFNKNIDTLKKKCYNS